MKHFTIDQLKDCEGKNGQQVLVAVNGKVYDVSSSRKWAGGFHMNRHRAWADLSNDIKAAPHGLDVLERFSLIGTITETELDKQNSFRGAVDSWLKRHPFFRRHPHPAIVHFPIGLILAAPFFEAVAYVFGSKCTAWAGFCCLALGVAAVPLALASGYFTWWINYGLNDSPLIHKKRFLAWATLVLGLAVVLVRIWSMPDSIGLVSGQALGYFAGLIVLAIITACIGYLGGKLTFPY